MIMRGLKRSNWRVKELSYFSIVRPLLEYSTTVWCPYKNKDIATLESIQRKAFRWVFKFKKKDKISSLMEDKGWHPLEKRRKDADLRTYYKILSGTFPFRLPNRSPHKYNTRLGITKMSSHMDAMKHFFVNRIVDLIDQ
jgi:hypothetical protein